jgi:hypothetical protein
VSQVGDFSLGQDIDLYFTSVDSTGAPTTITSCVVSIYKNNSTTQSTSGVTLTQSFDGVVGLNHVRVSTSADGTFYSRNSQFNAIITNGSISGTLVVGYVIGGFSLVKAGGLWDRLQSEHDVPDSMADGASLDMIATAITERVFTGSETANTLARRVYDHLDQDISLTAQASALVTLQADVDTLLLRGFPRAVAFSNFTFVMRNSVTNSIQSGLTVAGRISKDGGTDVALASSIAETSHAGFYAVNLIASELDADRVTLKFTATGAHDLPFVIFTGTQ